MYRQRPHWYSEDLFLLGGVLRLVHHAPDFINKRSICLLLIVFFLGQLFCQMNEPSGRLIAGDPVSFELDVQPVLTSAGCNAGACHGKQRGQNGFQLSLLGFDSDFDYSAITKQSRGRRIFPAAPQKSLLLLKASGEIPHGGGRRLNKESDNYKTLLAWLQQGNARAIPNETKLSRIQLNHNSRLLSPGESDQLLVTAFYADQSQRNVTAQATFQSNDPAIVSVNEKGVLIAGGLPGETAIMVRFMNVIEVCQVAIPLPNPVAESYYSSLPINNFIDELVWKKLRRLNIKPSAPIEDAKFMRRVYTDIIGRLPTRKEARQFLKDGQPEKRKQLVNDLLDRPEYAQFSANKWADLLRTNPYRVGIKTTLNYDNWIRRQFRQNVPYDEFVRSLVTARGSTFRNGAVTMFRDRRSPDELTTIVTQLFLGIRLECAKCHHHPFEKWSQGDFYSFAAYFSDVSRKGTGLSPPISGSEEIVTETGSGKVFHPTTGERLLPRPLYDVLGFKMPTVSQETGDEVFSDNRSADSLMEKLRQRDSQPSLRDQLANWMTSPDNSFFARVQVNRIWADLMGRGIVEPVDDLRATNPPTNAELLEALAADFQTSGFDQKSLIRKICNSYVYSLGSQPNPENVSDRLNHSRHYRQRLRAETLLDSIAGITGVDPTYAAMPVGSRSVEIWTHRTGSLFLDTFGRPNPNEDPPCMRTNEFTVTQSLHLMNAKEIHAQLRNEKGVVAKLAASEKKPLEIVEEIYLMIYGRFPVEAEMQFAISVITGENKGSGGDAEIDGNRKLENSEATEKKTAVGSLRRAGIEDLMWAMINSPEFSIQD